MRPKLSLDRSLPIPLGIQLRGLIEYGTACGELPPGSRLPSVRELARQLGVAPMTVAQVYKELQAAGIIRTRPGQGTFVDGALLPAGALQQLRVHARALVDEAARLGVGRRELIALIQSLPATPQPSDGQAMSMLMVGMYPASTREFAAAIATHLPRGDLLESCTMGELARSEELRRKARGFDLLITYANRRLELAAHVPGRPIVALSAIPSEATRRALAELDPRQRVCLVAGQPDYLPVMKNEVSSFAAHVPALSAALIDDPALPDLMLEADIIVYSTAAEAVLDRLPPGIRTLAYRHDPDARDIDAQLLPLLERLRNR